MIFLTSELHCEIGCFAGDGIRGVDSSGWIDEEARTGKLAVFVNGMNFDHGGATMLEQTGDLATDRGRSVFFSAQGRNRQAGQRDETNESGQTPARQKRALTPAKN
jgi:hypothetical protein